MNPIVLFDLDGTLTPPRAKITDSVVQALRTLSSRATIGIVTGSGMEYVREQALQLLNDKEIAPFLHIFPCNGTEHWKLSNTHNPRHLESRVYDKIFGISMEEHIGPEKFRDMLAVLCVLQADIAQLDPRIPLTGHFVSNRQSLVNWCPIGRNASSEQREEFVEQDASQNIRFSYISSLIDSFLVNDISGLTVTLGGDTSFDIYPTGWDKTYVLNHQICKRRVVYFIGDRCFENGNDKTLYEYFKNPEGPRSWETSVKAAGVPSTFKLPPRGDAFSTSGPEETIRIIEKEIIPNL